MFGNRRDRRPALRFREQLRFAVSDLRRRRGTAVVIIVSIAVAVVYLLLPSYFGAQLWRHQKAVFDRGLPTRIIARVADSRSSDSRFRPDRLSEIGALHGVVRARPYVECSVLVGLPRGSQLVLARSTEQDDPATAPSRLAWGRAVAGRRVPEAVLSHELFRKLGGRIVNARTASPERVTVEVRRTTDGRLERNVLNLAIVGVTTVPSSPDDGLYVPSDLVAEMDYWCAHQTDAPPGASGDAPQAELRYPAIIAYAQERERARIDQEAATFEVRMVEQDRVAAWEGPERLTVILRARGQAEPGRADAFAGLPWPATKRREFAIDDSPNARRLFAHGHRDDVALLGRPLSHAELGVVSCRDGETVDAIARRWPHARCVSVRELPSDAACTEDTLSWLLFDPDTSRSVCDHTLVVTDREQDAEWLARDLKLSLFPIDGRGPLASSGDESWRRSPHDGTSRAPGRRFTFRVAMGLDDFRRRYREIAARCQLARLPVVPATLREGGVNRVVYCCRDLPERRQADVARTWTRHHLRESPELNVGNAKSPPLRFEFDPDLPDATIAVDDVTWRHLTFAGRMSHAWPEREHPVAIVRIPLLEWEYAREFLGSRGLEFATTDAVRETALRRVRVTPLANPEQGVEDRIVGQLNEALPTFHLALPELRIPVEAGREQLTLTGSVAQDPTRFEVGLIHGRWVGDNPRGVVLPVWLSAKLFAQRSPESALGQRVRLRLAPHAPIAPDDRLELDFEILGWSRGSDAYLPVPAVKELELWRHGKLAFRPASSDFVTPREEREALGAVRCCIDADGIESVGPLVAWLEQRGYQTESGLAGQAALWRLLTLLVGMIAAFSLGCLLLSVMLVAATSLINVGAKTWEIGVLKSLGMSGFAVGRLYVYQGAILGVLGFVIGSLLAALGEPLLSLQLRASFSLPPDLLEEHLASLDWCWLFGVALPVSVGSASFAMFVPAWQAARLQPLDAIRRRI